MMQAEQDTCAWLPTSSTSLTDAAVSYATHGLRVIAVYGIDAAGGCGCGKPTCATHGKHPVGKGWQKSATSNAQDVIDARRARGACEHNVGLAMGGDTRLVAIDVDGPAGAASLAGLEATHGALPVTLTSATGRDGGGKHLIFSVPDHLDMARLRNSASKIRGSGIDVRSTGGQIVAPPSRHASGRRYEWIVRVPPAEMPEWLFNLMAADVEQPRLPVAKSRPGVTDIGERRYASKALADICDDIRSAPSGTRNVTLFKRACRMFEYCAGIGFSYYTAEAEMLGAAMSAGLTRTESETALASARTAAAKSPPRYAPELDERAPKPAPRRVEHAEDDGCDEDGVVVDAHAPRVRVAEVGTWRDTLKRSKDGKLLSCHANVNTVLTNHSAWAGVLAYNSFSESIVFKKPPPWGMALDDKSWLYPEILPTTSTKIVTWLAEAEDLIVGPDIVKPIMALVAEGTIVDPVVAYLDDLEWDGVPRLATWLHTYLGAPLGDDRLNYYTQEIGKRWMISAVARARVPGCQVDCTLILEGKQGCGKTTAVRSLVPHPSLYSETPINIGDKDAYMGLHGVWIYLFDELASTSRGDIEKVKNFLTSEKDRYRPPYGTAARDYYRKVVFSGSTNKGRYLVDETGNRRFWPVETGRIDSDGVERDRDQLWAEAAHLYAQGEKWYANTAELVAVCAEQQDARVEEEPWDILVARWLESPTDGLSSRPGEPRARFDVSEGVTTVDVMMHALGIKPEGFSKIRSAETRIGNIIRKVGWVPRRVMMHGVQRNRYFAS